MKSKINIHNFWRSDAFIILMFAVMSLMSGMILWNSHFVSLGPDLAFHWKRIYEIHDAILQGNILPKVTLNTFNQTGSAVISFYPNLGIYPMALLSIFVKSFISLYYTIFILRNFFALIVCYYACNSFVYNKKISFIFAISYTLSTFTLYFQSLASLGTTTAMIFMPLVLFGFLNLLEKNKWIELTIGMSGIILSHVLDVLMAVIFLFLFVLFNYKKLSDVKFLKALGKSVILTVLLTGIYWITFMILMHSNQIATPLITTKSHIVGLPLKTLFTSWLLRIREGISLASCLGLILGIVQYKKLYRNEKAILWIAIIFLYVSSSLFPWSVFHNTVVESTIQLTQRFLVVPSLLLTYIFSVTIVNLATNKNKKLNIAVFVVIILLIFQVLFQFRYIYKTKNYPNLTHDYAGKNEYIVTNNSELNHLISGFAQDEDYYPKSSISEHNIIDHYHLATYDGNKHIKMKLLGNGGYEFSNKARIKDLALPFLYYNGINYQVKLDGKTVNGFANKNSLMTIKNVNKGRHHVRIVVHNTKMQIVSYITSLIGLTILLGVLIRKYILRK